MPIILQSCKSSRILSGTYCYKYNTYGFFNSCLKLNADSTFTYESGGDMQIWSGNGFYRYINDKFVELTYIKPVVRSTPSWSDALIFKTKDSLLQISRDPTIRTLYDTTSGPIALVIKRGHYYFMNSNFRTIKFRTETYSKHRKLFFGKHYPKKRNILKHYSNR
jgi:hypothetical protein